MKRFFLILALVFSLQPSALLQAAEAVDVVFDLADLGLSRTQLTNRFLTARLLPDKTARAYGGKLIMADPKSCLIPASGQTNMAMIPGTYECGFAGRTMTTTFQITVPETNATQYAHQLLSTVVGDPTTAYTTSAADARFLSVFVTNNLVTIPALAEATNRLTPKFILQVDGGAVLVTNLVDGYSVITLDTTVMQSIWLWDDGTPMLWDDGTLITLENDL